MKITQVMLAKGFGGAERLFVDLCTALADSGHDVQSICLDGSRSAEYLSNRQDISLSTVQVLGWWDPFPVWKITKLLRVHKSEILQAHLGRGAFIGGKAARRVPIPALVTTHNYINPSYYKYITMIVPPTDDQRDYYIKQGVSPDRLVRIDHFSLLQQKKPKPKPDKQPLKIISMGRLVNKKGFHILIKAFKLLSENYDQDCCLYIGGDGPEYKNLINQVNNMDLQQKVKLTGWIKNTEEFLAQGDLFVLPSIDEPFGIVLLEAMAAGLPIVSTRSQGPKEILDDNTAFFADTGSEISLYQALLEACTNQDERELKASASSDVYNNRYSKEVILPKFEELYNKLVNR